MKFKKDSAVIPADFFNRPVLEVCPQLLGQQLVVRSGNAVIRSVITEVEAYDGPEDKACHASKGRTARTEVLFGPAGSWYIYLCYGVHWLLNVVTGPVDYPAAILIRGAGRWKGPRILTRELSIDKRFNALPAVPDSGLWIEFNGETESYAAFKRTARIGVGYAGEWAAKPYRFILEDTSRS